MSTLSVPSTQPQVSEPTEVVTSPDLLKEVQQLIPKLPPFLRPLALSSIAVVSGNDEDLKKAKEATSAHESDTTLTALEIAEFRVRGDRQCTDEICATVLEKENVHDIILPALLITTLNCLGQRDRAMQAAKRFRDVRIKILALLLSDLIHPPLM